MGRSIFFSENKPSCGGGTDQEYLDCIAVVFKEKIEGLGEDSFCYAVNENGTMLGVFDGCGGAGAKEYLAFGNKSGAYMASRAVAGAARNWFKQTYTRSDADTARCAGTLKEAINAALAVCKNNCGASTGAKMKGSLSKAFPTTAAIAICSGERGRMYADIFWAGDSRVYMLDSSGLAQMTADDLNGSIDAYENISNDAVLTNVINASADFTIHSRRVPLNMPCVVFCASDGCFGYIPSPMEFEYMLLNTLDRAVSVTGWEDLIGSQLAETSGDDYTFVAGVLGFGSFNTLKEHFRFRTEELYRDYIEPLGLGVTSTADELWREYRENYYRFG